MLGLEFTLGSILEKEFTVYFGEWNRKKSREDMWKTHGHLATFLETTESKQEVIWLHSVFVFFFLLHGLINPQESSHPSSS